MSHLHLTHRIKDIAESLGFDAVGVARVSRPSGTSDPPGTNHSSLSTRLYALLAEWLSRGYNGTMGWMEKDPLRRTHPPLVLPGCRSLVCVGMNYSTNFYPNEVTGNGRIARYAWGKDYHKIFKTRLQRLEKQIRELEPTAETRSYVDTGPLMEKAWAQEAGLGWIGKHSNLVSPQFGSWLLLGEVLTTLELEPDEPGTDLCGSCSLCIRSCPTQAISEPYVVDATRCISYLTIEYRDSFENLPDDLTGRIGNRIFGCDDCLDVCPFNANAEPTKENGFFPSPLALNPDLHDLARITEEQFTSMFSQSPIRRTKYRGFQRNVKTAGMNEAGPGKARSIPQS